MVTAGFHRSEFRPSGTVPSMVSLDEVARTALDLPEVAEGASRQAIVVRRRQGLRLGAVVQQGGHSPVRRCHPSEGPILALRVADLAEKEAVLQAKAFFTIPHFGGYAAILIQLNAATNERCGRRSSTAGWRVRRPSRRTSTSSKDRPAVAAPGDRERRGGHAGGRDGSHRLGQRPGRLRSSRDIGERQLDVLTQPRTGDWRER